MLHQNCVISSDLFGIFLDLVESKTFYAFGGLWNKKYVADIKKLKCNLSAEGLPRQENVR